MFSCKKGEVVLEKKKGRALLCFAATSYGADAWVWACDAEPTVGGLVKTSGATEGEEK